VIVVHYNRQPNLHTTNTMTTNTMSFPTEVLERISGDIKDQEVCLLTEEDKEYVSILEYTSENEWVCPLFNPIEYTNGVGLLITKGDFTTLVETLKG